METVWLLTYAYWDDSEVLGVFDSPDKAADAQKSLNSKTGEHTSIVQYNVNKLIEE